MGRDQERRTKQKLDHLSQSSSPQGPRRNYKRTASRGRSQGQSGTSMGYPCPSPPDGSDGHWTFEFALTPERNPQTGEVQIDAREQYLRKHGRRLQPGVCPRTPKEIPVEFGQHQVQYDTYPQMQPPRQIPAYVPRLSRNYSQQSLSVTKERESNPFIFSKDEALEQRFWNQFHQDFYSSVCLRPKHPHIATMEAIDWEHMANKESQVCDNVIEACEAFGLRDIMGFKYNWNVEIIAQFHSSFFYSVSDNTIHWTTSGVHFAVDYKTFSRLLGLGSVDLDRDQIHNELKLHNYDLGELYRFPRLADGKTSRLKSFYYVLNNLLRHTIAPKTGDATSINAYAKNILLRFAHNGRPFCITNFIWEELIAATNDSRRGFPYAPYIMYVIEKVTGICFHKETEHPVLKINRTRQPHAPKTPSPTSEQSQSPPPADSPLRRSHRSSRPSGPSSSRGPSSSHGPSLRSSRGPPVVKPPSLARRVLEAVFCMCKKQTSDVYEMRKDINELRTQQGLPTRDIGEPPVFEDPFAAHDAAMAAWHAAQEGGTYVEEEEEAEVAPAHPHRRPSRRHGKDPIEEEEEEVQAEEETEEEEEQHVSDNADDDDDDDGNASSDNGGDDDYEE